MKNKYNLNLFRQWIKTYREYRLNVYTENPLLHIII